eukprot:6179478-Pleurochrysis_carterae.AAC.1
MSPSERKQRAKRDKGKQKRQITAMRPTGTSQSQQASAVKVETCIGSFNVVYSPAPAWVGSHGFCHDLLIQSSTRPACYSITHGPCPKDTKDSPTMKRKAAKTGLLQPSLTDFTPTQNYQRKWRTKRTVTTHLLHCIHRTCVDAVLKAHATRYLIHTLCSYVQAGNRMAMY